MADRAAPGLDPNWLRSPSAAEITAMRHEIGYLKAEAVVAAKRAELLNKALTNAEDEAERFRVSAIRFKRRAEAAEAELARIEAGTDETACGLGPKGESRNSSKSPGEGQDD